MHGHLTFCPTRKNKKRRENHFLRRNNRRRKKKQEQTNKEQGLKIEEGEGEEGAPLQKN